MRGATPVIAWAAARWQLDQWLFLEGLVVRDFLDHSFTSADGHSGTMLYYLNILQKHHYEWLLAAILCVVSFWSWARARAVLTFWQGDDRTRLLVTWALIALAVPTLMRTKLPWYLNPFYPMFALGVGWILAHAVSAPALRRRMLVAVIVLMCCVAEGKILWYSFNNRSMDGSVQGLLLSESELVRGTRVFRSSWDHADAFVLRGLLDARP